MKHKRKEAYEAKHPETVNGENQHTRVRQVGEGTAPRFTADTAAKTGTSERAFAARDRSFEEIRFWLPSMLTAAQTDWTRGFIASVMVQSKRPNWRPSEKQMGVLRRVTADWFAGRINDRDDCEVIE